MRLREYYHDGRGTGRLCTDEDYYENLKTLAGGLPIRQVVIDPSAASMIALIRRRGEFSVRRAKNPVLPGIRLVSSLIQAGVVKISEGCTNALREFGLYTWEEGQDAPRKENDHAMDDIRYFCATILGRDRELLRKIGGNEG